ncbi:MAG: 2-phosphosulfolactate phosphatase [Pseudomonadales bacterium]
MPARVSPPPSPSCAWRPVQRDASLPARQGGSFTSTRGVIFTSALTKFSLSPGSLMHAVPGDRVVLPSPNGSAISHEAVGFGDVVAGCLRNARAVAKFIASRGYPVAIVVAGERWSDGSLRPAIEDVLGAGAIVSMLDSTCSPEARGAAAAFENMRGNLLGALRGSSSGRELVGRGFDSDVTIAAELDATETVPLLADGYFRAA